MSRNNPAALGAGAGGMIPGAVVLVSNLNEQVKGHTYNKSIPCVVFSLTPNVCVLSLT